MKQVSKNIGVKKVENFGKKLASRKDGAVFSSTQEEQIRAYERRSAMRESLQEVWDVDIAQALRIFEDRQVVVGSSDFSHVS